MIRTPRCGETREKPSHDRVSVIPRDEARRRSQQNDRPRPFALELGTSEALTSAGRWIHDRHSFDADPSKDPPVFASKRRTSGAIAGSGSADSASGVARTPLAWNPIRVAGLQRCLSAVVPRVSVWASCRSRAIAAAGPYQAAYWRGRPHHSRMRRAGGPEGSIEAPSRHSSTRCRERRRSLGFNQSSTRSNSNCKSDRSPITNRARNVMCLPQRARRPSSKTQLAVREVTPDAKHRLIAGEHCVIGDLDDRGLQPAPTRGSSVRRP